MKKYSYIGATGLQQVAGVQQLMIFSSYNSSKALNLPNSALNNQNPLQLWDASRSYPSEQWQIIRGSDGYYSISPSVSRGSKCASVDDEWQDNGAVISSYDCISNQNQKWIIIPVVREPGKYIFFSKHSGKCMSVSGGNKSDNGTAITQFKYQNRTIANGFYKKVINKTNRPEADRVL